MIRTRLLLAIVGALAIALPANAQFFTTQLATAHQNIVPPGSDVNNVSIVQGTTFGGASYANNISTTGAPVVGNTLRIVSADVITGYTNPGFTTSSFGGGNSQVVAVFAGQGTVTNVSGGIASASLDSGRVFLFSVPLNSFNPTQPSTWGITGSPLATFGAVAPQNVNIPGGGAGDPIAFLANQVNVTSINSTAGQQTQSRLLTAPVGSDPFLTITTASVPAGFIPDGEGEFFRANTTVFNGSTSTFRPRIRRPSTTRRPSLASRSLPISAPGMPPISTRSPAPVV